METVKTVLAGFVGIRRRSAHERAQIHPLHLIIVAIVLVVVFVLTLRALVGLIVS